MNGFADRGLDEGDFGSAKGLSVVKSFDAFRKSSSVLVSEPVRIENTFEVVFCLWWRRG